jgi:hypothetical protein
MTDDEIESAAVVLFNELKETGWLDFDSWDELTNSAKERFRRIVVVLYERNAPGHDRKV